MPLFKTPIIKTPIMVGRIPPVPPALLVPPITTAVIACRSYA